MIITCACSHAAQDKLYGRAPKGKDAEMLRLSPDTAVIDALEKLIREKRGITLYTQYSPGEEALNFHLSFPTESTSYRVPGGQGDLRSLLRQLIGGE